MTPDGRYFVHKQRLWRCTNPNLSETERQQFVRELMKARRDVKSAKASGDEDAMQMARDAVNEAKIQLGERGPTWWDDDTDHSRQLVRNTPYADWWETR
ncbi:hypothetical protein [Rhodopirellula sp. P2]|uniref:hypothetical protein n=1 Tax=Rhodopirellula sp. P2 TaxID=2127060 RepID=UPI002368AAAB|nr:hypothetical protein [Rhodopirellula sp. P2]WDQ16442.1 hypothetical protein PSR62_22870 [Rhodopirellula sp. P2]